MAAFASAAAVTVMAASAARVAAVAAIATVATQGESLAVSADEGDGDQSHEQRHTQHNDTIHPSILQL
jgi:hypothetical protein